MTDRIDAAAASDLLDEIEQLRWVIEKIDRVRWAIEKIEQQADCGQVDACRKIAEEALKGSVQ